jgi:hypothetical protein
MFYWGCLKSGILMDLTFELLCDELCDPLWFNALFLTTKSHQGLTKVREGLFQQPRGRGMF